jgi:hypothetical protein
MDLDPSNVLVDIDGTVRFIDIDDSLVGPAPLAVAGFVARCHDRGLYRSYGDACVPALAVELWPACDVAAAAVKAWFDWERVLQNTQRHEIVGVLDAARQRLRERLSRDAQPAARL